MTKIVNLRNNIFNTMENIKDRRDLKNLVKGFMVESFLKDGNQPIQIHHPEQTDLDGLSITDPCLGWEISEEMILKLFEKLKDESFLINEC